MPRILLAIAVVYVAVLIYTVFDITLRQRSLIKVMPRAAWIAVVIVLPVVGIILWFLFGRHRPQAPAPGIAPDDDPEYLRRLSEDVELKRMQNRRRSQEHGEDKHGSANTRNPADEDPDTGDDQR